MNDISDKDYNHAKSVFDIFNMRNLGDYHDFYVKSDTLLLSDIFEEFRKTCIKEYELDPCYFVSAPGLSWEACLKLTKVELELFTDMDMLLMFEKGIRGGISQAIYKYAKANNKYMKSYNKNITSSYLQYFDASNLHGWAMCKKLPIGGFKWSNPNKYTEEVIKSYDKNGNYAVLPEVDIEYPKELHKSHCDLPFLCDRKKLNKTNKLITSFEDKKEYVVHISALKQALNHGLKLTKMHRVIRFAQKEWMKTYIEKNTKLKIDSKNEFENNFYKLMNNSVYGKTMENIRNHRDIKLVTTNRKRKKLSSEPNYHSCKYFSENLIAIEMRKTKIYVNKPVYMRQAVLDISKTLMYEFWYDYVKLKYGDEAKLCYMDTDSFIMFIETEDFYKDISNDVKERFDTSGYHKDHKRLPVGLNKNVIDEMKDKLNGLVKTEFCA